MSLNTNRKSSTDLHWDERAGSGKVEPEKVNIGDVTQRALETDFVLSVLPAGAKILEVGCGNGHLTNILREKAGFVDAFDYSANMITMAKNYTLEKNNRFFVDNVLDLKNTEASYEAIVCVRVLINLRDLEEQKLALENLAKMLKPGGKLILIEGFKDGFEAANKIRTDVGMPAMQPAAINFYSHVADFKPVLDKHFTIGKTFHSGMFDFLTRIVYPTLVGAENAKEPGEFHDKIRTLAGKFNPDAFENLGRLRGFELIKR